MTPLAGPASPRAGPATLGAAEAHARPDLRHLRSEAVAMGLLAALVGFASSFAVILAGLRGVGASEAEAAGGLTAAALAMGIGGLTLGLGTRLPIAVAWTTPGAALLATASMPAGGFAEAVGGFVVSGVLLTLAALVRPLGRAVAAIPVPIASAMLAGILLDLTLAPVRAVAADWRLGLPIVLAWLAGGRVHRLLAVPAALLAFAAVALLGVDLPPDAGARIGAALGPALVPVAPRFEWDATVGIALPLFVVTMAGQNIPGLAVLRANGYGPSAPRAFAVTGGLTALFAPFGAHAVNLAAITAAMCAGPEAGPDPARRYWAGAVSGLAYILLALVAGAAALFVSLAPPVLIEAVAGLALIASFSAAIVAALADPRDREAAAVTFLVAASGVAIAGVSGAFWGLVAGLAVHALARR